MSSWALYYTLVGVIFGLLILSIVAWYVFYRMAKKSSNGNKLTTKYKKGNADELIAKEKISDVLKEIHENNHRLNWQLIHKIEEVSKPYAYNLTAARNQQIKLNEINSYRDQWFNTAKLEVLKDSDGYITNKKINGKTIKISETEISISGKKINIKKITNIELDKLLINLSVGDQTTSIECEDYLDVQEIYILLKRFS